MMEKIAALPKPSRCHRECVGQGFPWSLVLGLLGVSREKPEGHFWSRVGKTSMISSPP